MLKVLAGIFIIGLTLLVYPVGSRVVSNMRNQPLTSDRQIRKSLDISTLSPPQEQVKQSKDSKDPEKQYETRIITLEARNTVTLRGPVTGGSVGKLMKELSRISRTLNSSEYIYLVLDTPGGSVTDGVQLIDLMEALPQKIKTVTLFAASMGFQIVENNPGERLIIRNGVLMSHRATVGGVGGQLDGELETRVNYVKREIDYLDGVDAIRMGISLAEYKKKIKDELWVRGFDSVSQRVADDMVLIRCGVSMDGTTNLVVDTFFGPVSVVFDNCPLYREPISVEFSKVKEESKLYLEAIFHKMFYDQISFTQDVIVTDKFSKIFP